MRVEIAEQHRRGANDTSGRRAPVGACRHVLGEGALGGACRGILLLLHHQSGYLLARIERKQLQVRLHVPIVHVHPELVELVRRGERGVQVNRSGFGLAELLARGRRDERRDQAVRVAVLDPADQLHARRDVPPLVAATHLQGAAALPVQMQEIERLEQHVAEFGVRQTALEAGLHRFLLEHQVDGEVLADVPQKVDQGQRREPLGVVEHERTAGAGADLEKARHLIAHAAQVLAQLLPREQRPLAALAGGITDEAGATTH